MGKKRRKLDQYLRAVHEDPEFAFQEATLLSNQVFRLLVGIGFTVLLLILMRPIEQWARDWYESAGIAVIVFTTNGLGWLAVLRVRPRIVNRPSSFNQIIILILITVALSKLVFFLGWSPFLAPLPMLAMILSLSFGQTVAFFLVIGVGLHLWFMNNGMLGQGPVPGSLPVPRDLVLLFTLTFGGLVSVLGMARVRQQSRPVLVGAFAGLVQALIVLAFKVMGARPIDSWEQLRAFLEDPSWALTGGLVSGAIVTCILPGLERSFGIITERRLLALTDPNNKLLQALLTRAPGTYTHTMRVADLASEAARAIGADQLLARVGAYYHDIGKITKPEYFVENWESGTSPHDRLRPSMSKLIIISHVKEGIDLATEQKLPQKIIDMIPMHHGTTVVEYFFYKAKAEGICSPASEVEYRYPGPKPQFREAGILMLADVVEATAKSITEPNPTRFRTMVHELLLKRLLDHQLDESDLTMWDLTRIEDSFVRTLTSMYHGRIRYPGSEGGLSGSTASDRRPPSSEGPPRPGSGSGQPANGTNGPATPRGQPHHETHDLHRQPAEVSAARSGPAAKDPLVHPPRPWPRR